MNRHTEFPVLDSDRAVANQEHHRAIIDCFGFTEPYVDEMDAWVALPVRLTHDTAAGWRIEAGPYSFGAADVATLEAAIAAYRAATDGQRCTCAGGGTL
ncbi:hypothetical protein [Mycobacterium sp. pW045]|uniref:hypothetical protein n=1 Tax=Mycobacterium sp. pW045 TaxID=3238984 RepID=UPI00351BE929